MKRKRIRKLKQQIIPDAVLLTLENSWNFMQKQKKIIKKTETEKINENKIFKDCFTAN